MLQYANSLAHLVLGGATDETLGVGEGDIGRRGALTEIVGNDLHGVVLPHTDTCSSRTTKKIKTQNKSKSVHCTT